MDGWLKLFYRFKEWEWYDDTNMVRLFIHLLLSANYKPLSWRGKIIPRGSLITSRSKLAEQTNLTEREVRTCLTRLKTTNEIAIETTNRFTIITITNYERYQYDCNNVDQRNDQRNDQQATSKRPASDQPTTTSKEYKKERIKEYFVVDARTREEFLDDFFAPERMATIEALCMNLHTDMATLKHKANEVVVEWEAASQPKHKDISDAYRHLISQIRIKLSKPLPQKNNGTLYTFSTNQIDNGTTSSPGQHIDPSTARQWQFAEHIITKLNTPDSPEPDISDLY